jgi:hypothetical protein
MERNLPAQLEGARAARLAPSAPAAHPSDDGPATDPHWHVILSRCSLHVTRICSLRVPAALRPSVLLTTRTRPPAAPAPPAPGPLPLSKFLSMRVLSPFCCNLKPSSSGPLACAAASACRRSAPRSSVFRSPFPRRARPSGVQQRGLRKAAGRPSAGSQNTAGRSSAGSVTAAARSIRKGKLRSNHGLRLLWQCRTCDGIQGLPKLLRGMQHVRTPSQHGRVSEPRLYQVPGHWTYGASVYFLRYVPNESREEQVFE